MIYILGGIFLLLVFILGTDRTAKTIITLALNGTVLLGIMASIQLGFNPIIATLIGCLLITFASLFFQNEVNEKTIAAAIGVTTVLAMLFVFIWFLVCHGNLQGFPIGEYNIRETNGYSENIGINMVLIQISVMILILIGAIIDTSISITSAVFEVKRNNPTLTKIELFNSGLSMGKDILSSTVNTLFFIFMGEYMITFITYMEYYNFQSLINSKEFVQEIVGITISAIGCILIIPISSFICTLIYSHSTTSLNKLKQNNEVNN